jgi:hypothetical protein
VGKSITSPSSHAYNAIEGAVPLRPVWQSGRGHPSHGQIEGVQFTLETKEALVVHGKQQMEHNRTLIPDTDMIRNSFRSVKKITTATGHARFGAEHDTQFGHADHWWAYCLAQSAALTPGHGLLDLYKEQADAIKNASSSGLTREPGPPAEEFKRQADAQMEQAKKTDDMIAGVFGAQHVDNVGHSAMTKPVVVAQTPRCPHCQNVNISRTRVAGVSGDIEEKCGACGWTARVQ